MIYHQHKEQENVAFQNFKIEINLIVLDNMTTISNHNRNKPHSLSKLRNTIALTYLFLFSLMWRSRAHRSWS